MDGSCDVSAGSCSGCATDDGAALPHLQWLGGLPVLRDVLFFVIVVCINSGEVELEEHKH
jgi:hypothetical protein